jgi:hypothetical protein
LLHVGSLIGFLQVVFRNTWRKGDNNLDAEIEINGTLIVALWSNDPVLNICGVVSADGRKHN